MLSARAHESAAITSASLVASTSQRAGPPTPKVVRGASGAMLAQALRLQGFTCTRVPAMKPSSTACTLPTKSG